MVCSLGSIYPLRTSLTSAERIAQFKDAGITAVFNLQLPGEHPYCGDKIIAESGFSYLPEELYAATISFYNWGWRDMEVPSLVEIINIVQLMSFVIDNGGKVAVHCHAGYGRTGIAIACYLMYSSVMTNAEAVEFVRSRRRRCIQTRAQQLFCRQFYECKG